MIRATKLSAVFMVRRYIDDIIFISESRRVSEEVIENLKSTFGKFNLELTSTIMLSEDGITTLSFWMLNMYWLKKITKISSIQETLQMKPLEIRRF